MAHNKHTHAGIERTYYALQRAYVMRGMYRVVRNYVKHCSSCLVNKPMKHAPRANLIPISAPAAPWELITMDFVVKLHECKPTGGLCRYV